VSPGAAARLAAIVVTHDRAAAVAETVARLLAEPVDHVLVVDNASGDDTLARLAAIGDARLEVVTAGRNLGGAGGFELGMRRAVAARDPDWLILMDDDARPEPGAIARFRALDLDGTEALAAAVRYPDGAICEMNRPSLNPFWHRTAFLRTLAGGGRAGFHLPDAAYSDRAPRPVDAASFVGLFLSRAAVGRAGFPDGRLFLYGDDVLYTLALSRSGGRIIFHPAVRFEHACATLGAGGPRVYRPLWKAYYNYRNGLLAYRYAAGALFWAVLPVVLYRWSRFARHYREDGPAFRRLLRLAVRDALARHLDRPLPEVMAAAGGAGGRVERGRDSG
jgi:GT2 family glycosyltransferase